MCVYTVLSDFQENVVPDKVDSEAEVIPSERTTFELLKAMFLLTFLVQPVAGFGERNHSL